jgi:serine/threonine protein kinase
VAVYKYDDWEIVEELGSGGQSDVFLVRHPFRKLQRQTCLQAIRKALDANDTAELAYAIHSNARPDEMSQPGVKKLFRIGGSEERSANRLKQEIQVLQQQRSGLPQLLDFNEAERWIVTEYFPKKTLKHSPSKFAGKANLALSAFLSLVETVASLHEDNIIHGDIKPDNVFVREGDALVLGDFGIIYVAGPLRHTQANESAGARHFIPPWADIRGRLGNVTPSFDVYMLGKLLWCMVSGREFLLREEFAEPEYNLTVMFPHDPHMFIINNILSKCIVAKSEDCVSTSELRSMVRMYVDVLSSGGQLLRDGVPRPCHVCGHGNYQKDLSGAMRLWSSGGATDIQSVPVHTFVCDYCGHLAVFKHIP